MPTFLRRSTMPVSANALFAWHERAGAFERLVPPWQDVRVVAKEGSIHEGDKLVMAIGPGPFSIEWEAIHEGYIAGKQFVDVQRRGPFAAWRHTHRCIPEADGASTLEDHIDYALPLGALGQWVGGRIMQRQLGQMFTFRHERTMNDLKRHASYGDIPPLRVAITGASGLVGKALSAFLTTGGHTVLPLVRRAPDRAKGEIQWSVADGTIETEALEGVDAVVHLAGENIGGGLWTDERKRRVVDSRVKGTGLIAKTLARLKHPPKVLVSASAIGFYGDRGDEILREDASPGGLFISEVCQAWEDSAQPARDAGIRVVHPRIGVVVTPSGGALKSMLLPFKLGLGGPVGSGRQYLSWVSLDDLVGAITMMIVDERAEGPINVVGPAPVPQKAFAKTLASVLGRPAVLPLPAFAVKAMMGQMGKELLLASQRVEPARLQALGFEFTHPTLESALRFELGAG